MPNNDLLKQAEQLLTYYTPDSHAYRVLRAVIDGASRGKISDSDLEAAGRLRDELPNSTISLMLQKIITGSTEALTTESLARWIAATGAERKKRQARADSQSDCVASATLRVDLQAFWLGFAVAQRVQQVF